MQRTSLEEQDRYLEVISVITQHLKHQGEDFGKEVNEQIKLVEKISEKIDHTSMNLAKVDTRLGQLISEMDFCKMWCVVIVEVILIVVIMCM